MTDIQGIQGNPRERLERIAEEPLAPSVLAVTLMPPDGQNATSFTQSLMDSFAHDAANAGSLVRGKGPMFIPTTPMRLADNRNMAAKILLDEVDADYLLFIDSDMGFDPSAVPLLLAASDPIERPVIGALCFGLRKQESDGQGGWRSVPFPTLMDWKTLPGMDQPGFVPRYDYTPDSVTQVAATGAAFLLIHRGVLARMRAELGDTWFDRARMREGEEMMGEDISFCARLGRLGIPLFVHTGVRTSHLKPLWVNEAFYQGARVLAALDEQETTDV